MRTVSVLAALLGVTLIASYLTWTDDAQPLAPGEVTLLDIRPAQLNNAVWTDASKRVTLEQKQDKAGVYYAVTVETFEKAEDAKDPEDADGADDTDGPAQDDAVAHPVKDASSSAPPVVAKTESFVGGKAAQTFWESLAPFVAVRELPVGTEGLAPFGLDDPEATLVLSAQGQSTTIAIGSTSFGTRDRYAKLSDKLVLLDSQMLRPVEYASTRLVEHALSPWSIGEIAQVTVVRANDTRTFIQQHRDDPTAAFWATKAEPNTKSVEVAAWVAKLLRIRARRQVPASALPTDLVPVFAYVLHGAQGTWRVEVSKQMTGDDTTWYATSTYLRGTVELTGSLVVDAVADLGVIFGEEPAPEPEPAAEPVAPGVVPLAPGVDTTPHDQGTPSPAP